MNGWKRIATVWALGAGMVSAAAREAEPPVIPVGLDAYRMWERWAFQRIGARATMRSTYDRTGGNRTADASHFLYQERDDFNVTLDVEGPGILYFARYNHWHGSPWHYEVDGVVHIVQETSSADPTRPVAGSVFLPEHLFPQPLTWTWSVTKGANLMWVPIAFERSFRMAYSRTFYGTGYYIYHHYVDGIPLSQPIAAWNGRTPPDPAVLDLLNRAGTDIAPRDIAAERGALRLDRGGRLAVGSLPAGPRTIRALKLSLPRAHAVPLGRARLRITWDDRPQPSVDAPLCLFYGAGTLTNRDGREYLVKGLPMSIRYAQDTVHLECYFPMPFFRSARIELDAVPPLAGATLTYEIRHEPLQAPPNHLGYFHATYRDHPDPAPGHDLVLLDTDEAEGGGPWSGTFAGTSFIFTHRAFLPTLEGDPRFFFDDSLTPQAYGTGTEEWGGGGDYWGGLNMTLPLAGHPVGARSAAEAKDAEDLIHSAYRFLLADLMPFGRRAVIRLEHGGENASREHSQTVTSWYGLPAASLVLTDTLDVGDPACEKAHAYVSPEASEPVAITSRYEWGVDGLTVRPPNRPLADPPHAAEFEFQADGGKTYTIWARGRAIERNNRTDAFWVQFDGAIGTDRLGPGQVNDFGMGNWLDDPNAGLAYAWSSGRPQDPPLTVRFDRSGTHRLRIQPRDPTHRVDQIWLSATQKERPASTAPMAKPEGALSDAIDEIVLDAGAIQTARGAVRVIDDAQASTGKAIKVGGADTVTQIEVYPAHTQIGRHTTGTSEFTLRLTERNLGVLLRRTLDYAFPNQRAEVFVADAGPGVANPAFAYAGVWYLAGSNTCYHSWPRGEIDPPSPVIITSNRRFRDDEFLVPRRLTEGRSAIRVRVRFTPVARPLLPGMPVPDLAWSELTYAAYCFVMPAFTP